MPVLYDVKTTFTAGQVSRELLGRADLRAYANGALTLKNVFIQPTGGVTRRAGLRYHRYAAGRRAADRVRILDRADLYCRGDGREAGDL